MDCVCILFRKRIKAIKPDLEKLFLQSSWEESLKVMSDTSFLRKIVEYPTDVINAEMVDLMLPYFNYRLVFLSSDELDNLKNFDNFNVLL